MRENNRKKYESENWWKNKNNIMSISVISIVFLMIIGIAINSNHTDAEKSDNITSSNQIISLAPENKIENNTKTASSQLGKTIEESENGNEDNSKDSNKELLSNKNSNQVVNNKIEKNTISNTQKTISSSTKKEKANQEEFSKNVNASVSDNKNIEFSWPIKGELLKGFSTDNLLYSSTLQEWTIHNGIDIKADKSSIVVCSTDGIVKSIKNDPRYGLTVVIEHQGGYRTIYSNLLTAEFITEGEKVKKGQTIGTVGNSANFEIADEIHLHFEIQKDGEYVDPTLYLK